MCDLPPTCGAVRAAWSTAAHAPQPGRARATAHAAYDEAHSNYVHLHDACEPRRARFAPPNAPSHATRMAHAAPLRTTLPCTRAMPSTHLAPSLTGATVHPCSPAFARANEPLPRRQLLPLPRRRAARPLLCRPIGNDIEMHRDVARCTMGDPCRISTEMNRTQRVPVGDPCRAAHPRASARAAAAQLSRPMGSPL